MEMDIIKIIHMPEFISLQKDVDKEGKLLYYVFGRKQNDNAIFFSSDTSLMGVIHRFLNHLKEK